MMSNILKRRNLSERRGAAGTFLALTLSASLAAFGCTTNRVPGDGEPVRNGTYVAPAATPGSSGGTTGVTVGPMFSSSRVYDHPGVTPRQAAALAASDGLPSVRYLGPVSPGPSPTGNNPMPTNQFSWPALQANPQVTVNSSSSSPAVSVVNSGAGDALAATNVLTTASGTVSGTTVDTANSAALIQSTTGTTAPVPLGAAIPLTPSTGALTPAATVGTAGPVGAVTSPSVATSNARLGTPTGSTVLRTARTAAGATARTISNATGNVRLITNANGAVTLTNVSVTTPAANGATAAATSNATTNTAVTTKGTRVAPVAAEKPQQ